MKSRANSLWTAADDALLKDLLDASTPPDRLVILIGRPLRGIERRAKVLGLDAGYRGVVGGKLRRHWTQEEDRSLREMVGKRTPVEEIAAKLDRVPRAVRERALHLGVAIPSARQAPARQVEAPPPPPPLTLRKPDPWDLWSRANLAVARDNHRGDRA